MNSPLLAICVAVLSIATAAHAADAPAKDAKPADPATAPELKATVPDDFVEHKAGDSGVTLKAPKAWTEAKLDPGGDAKLDLVADDKGRGVNVVVVAASKGMTVQSSVADTPADILRQVPGSKILSADLVKLAGQPAARFIWEAQSPTAGVMRVCQFQVVKNEKTYTLTYAAKRDDYEPLIKTVEQIAVSMRVP